MTSSPQGEPCYKGALAYLNGVSEAMFKIGMCLPAGPCVAINVPAGQWHRVYAKESGTVLMESKNGKWEPLSEVDVLR